MTTQPKTTPELILEAEAAQEQAARMAQRVEELLRSIRAVARRVEDRIHRAEEACSSVRTANES
jgi:hypothetical protein